jgi:hypothetical protein
MSLYIGTLLVSEQTYVTVDNTAESSNSVPPVGISAESVWYGADPPFENPLHENSLDNATNGVVTYHKNRPITRIGTSRRMAVTDTSALKRSIPQSWGDSTSYKYTLTDALGNVLDENQTGWTVLRESGLVLIKSADILSNESLFLSYYTYADDTVDSILNGLTVPAPPDGILLTQSSHGFSVGNAILQNGGIWEKAYANTASGKYATHVVSSTKSVHIFTIASIGLVTVPSHGFGSVGSYLFLLTTPGEIGTTAPSGVGTQVVARVINSDTIDVFPTTSGVLQTKTLCYYPPYSSTISSTSAFGVSNVVYETGQFYKWTNGVGALPSTQTLSKTIKIPTGAFMLSQSDGVCISYKTSDISIVNNSVTITLRKNGTVIGTTSAVSTTLTDVYLINIPDTFTSTDLVILTIELTSNNGNIIHVGRLLINWITRIGVTY